MGRRENDGAVSSPAPTAEFYAVAQNHRLSAPYGYLLELLLEVIDISYPLSVGGKEGANRAFSAP
ncbi:hypothetical protein ES703_120736 [subsurface metagenome]